MRLALFLFLAFAAGASWAQSDEDAYSRALKRSLERSRQLYPDSAVPGTPLGEAVQARINWLQKNDPGAFSDPEWPMKVASTAASALGLYPAQRAPAAPAPSQVMPAQVVPGQKRYLATVTKSFSIVGANFRKNQQIVLESLQDYNKRGITMVDGQPVLLWLDNIQILRELPPGAAPPALVKVEAAKYGFPGKSPISVAPMVQSLVAPSATGAQEVMVSDALLSAAAAQRLNRSVSPTYVTDPVSGAITLGIPYKVLTVTYSLNGQKKTKQAYEGQVLTLD